MMDPSVLDPVIDALDAPQPMSQLPAMPHEATVGGMRIMALPPGPCRVRYRSDRHLINVELNAWRPFRIALAQDRHNDVVGQLGGLLVVPADAELTLAGVNCRSDLVMEVTPEALEDLAGEPVSLAPLSWVQATGSFAMGQQAVAHLEAGAPNKLLLEGLAMAICGQAIELSRTQPAKRSARLTPGEPRMRRVIEYIEDNIDQDVSLGTLASVACLSPFHFARSFRACFDETPHNYVQRRRIARATALLEESASPIAEVALSCGFSSQSHFTTAFRQSTGATPAAYRRAHRH